MAWLTESALREMGFAQLGTNVLISDKASIYNCKNISIGSNIRIDDFCVLSAGVGGMTIGNHVHIAVFAAVIGAGKVVLSDFCGLSSRVTVYSSNDDYSGSALTNPTVPAEFTRVTHRAVIIGRHVIVGSGSIILPGAILEDGVAVGALSLVTGNCEAFSIYMGVPAKRIKARKRELLELEKTLLQRTDQSHV